MITLKENQQNTITFQKEIDTPLVTSSLQTGYVYNIITYPTLQNNTDLSSITYTNNVEPNNPRWVTLKTIITGSGEYNLNELAGLGGTTYNLEIWYGPTGSASTVWSQTTTTWGETTQLWNQAVDYNGITLNSTLVYSDRIFVSGSVQPNQKKYISSNEDATYIVYTG